MSEVKYPVMRLEVLSAVAALSDTEYQQRVWIGRESPTPKFYDDLTANVHVLYDDCQVLPDPESALGTVLLPGDEVARLRDLDQLFGPLIDTLGDAPDSVYLASPQWAAVVRAASRALSAMVLAGGFVYG